MIVIQPVHALVTKVFRGWALSVAASFCPVVLPACNTTSPPALQTSPPEAPAGSAPLAGPADPPPVADTRTPLDLAAAASALFPDSSRFTVSPVEPCFLLATPRTTLAPSSLHERARLLLETATTALFHERFTRPPTEPVVVYVLPTRVAYEAFCREHLGAVCATTLGVYRREAREIIVNAEPGLGTLNHEIVHPLLHEDFREAPDWLNEGLGSLMEAARFPAPGEIEGTKNWRLPRLKNALASPAGGARARIGSLFGMSNEAFHDADSEALHYSLARYVCMWLDERGELWSFYRVWRDGYPDDPTGEKAFRWVVEQSPDEANDAWVTWVKAL